jgi:hypothetical protein
MWNPYNGIHHMNHPYMSLESYNNCTAITSPAQNPYIVHVYRQAKNKSNENYTNVMGIARRGSALCKVMPNVSVMSISSGFISSASFQLKQWTREANIKCTIRLAKGNPGQILLPAPKGMSSKSLPLKSMSFSKNLSGRNKFGSDHMLESRPIAHTFTSICAFLGTVKPHISTSFSALWGTRKGAGGCNRRVSFTTARR